jgi:3-hydroxybutyryl-CoA dehydrogenase
VLASNSSSYPTSQIVDAVTRPERVLNMHFYMPPLQNAVELMSCGMTKPELIEALMEILPRFGLEPYHVQRESIGFIFNRIWAAIKRESLTVVADGIATPKDVDRIFQSVLRSAEAPFRLMDKVGLDVVLDIEEHYAAAKGHSEGPRRLLRGYVQEGRLGQKTGCGFYDDYS